jgi:hypothetical protein
MRRGVWIEIVIQVALAAGGVPLAVVMYGRKRI